MLQNFCKTYFRRFPKQIIKKSPLQMVMFEIIGYRYGVQEKKKPVEVWRVTGLELLC